MKPTEKSAPKLLNDAVDGLAQASGACSQLIHTRQDPRFMLMRKTIEMVSDICKQQATYAASIVTGVRH